MESKIAHLTFIQGVITRMGNNSFLLKGWSVTIVAALFALAAQGANKYFILIAYLPVLMFWLLDSFFLHQERLFRELYKQVATGDITSEEFTLNTSLVSSQVSCRCNAMFSKTLLIFYGFMIAIILLVTFFVFC